MRKTALLTGVAGLFLMTAPAIAQDSTAPQTPPADSAAQEPAQPQQLTLQPGMTVRGSDGADLGQLEGVRNGPSGQELTVRGPDGQLRGVPTTGIRQEGDAVVVDFNSGQFQSAPAITDEPAPTEAAPAPADPYAAPTDPTSATPAPGETSEPMGPTTEPTPPADPSTAPSADQPPAADEAPGDEPTEEDPGA